MGGCCARDEDYESAKNIDSLKILIEKDIIYFVEQKKAINSEIEVIKYIYSGYRERS